MRPEGVRQVPLQAGLRLEGRGAQPAIYIYIINIYIHVYIYIYIYIYIIQHSV